MSDGDASPFSPALGQSDDLPESLALSRRLARTWKARQQACILEAMALPDPMRGTVQPQGHAAAPDPKRPMDWTYPTLVLEHLHAVYLRPPTISDREMYLLDTEMQWHYDRLRPLTIAVRRLALAAGHALERWEDHQRGDEAKALIAGYTLHALRLHSFVALPQWRPINHHVEAYLFHSRRNEEFMRELWIEDLTPFGQSLIAFKRMQEAYCAAYNALLGQI